ncbi:MAG: hypothetical protein ACOX4N_00395 [Dethiobacteraceae bacterium]|jgi:hypothetical protein
MLEKIGMVATLGVAIFLLFFNRKPQEEADSTQDLLRYKSISPDGIIELPDGLYRLVLEVEPINIALMNDAEQEAAWTTFREMINILTVNFYFCVQSRHMDLKEYMDNIDARAKLMEDYPKITAYHQKLRSFLEQENADNSIKDHRHYLILEIDPHEMTSNVQVKNQALSTLTAGFQQKRLSGEEARAVAKQELENSAMIAHSYLNRIGIQSYRLNYTGVLEVCYAALNRDLAPIARFDDIDSKEMFAFNSYSITPAFAREVPPEDDQLEEEEAGETRETAAS